MKTTFYNLSEQKRKRLIKTCIKEFGAHGFEHGSLDRITKDASISKGGLYEYINSKEDLFVFIVSYTISSLYDYIEEQLKSKNVVLPPDILERFRLISSIAIDFYIENPDIISLIVKTNQLADASLFSKIQEIFLSRFATIFNDISTTNLAFDHSQLLDLLRWLLIKTRNDFLLKVNEGGNVNEIKNAYLKEWELYLTILSKGIYKTKPRSNNGTRT